MSNNDQTPPKDLGPLKCEEVTRLEEDYLNGTLSGTSQEEQVIRHLKSCSDCTERLSAYQELLGRLFASLEPVTPAPAVKAALLARLNSPVEPGSVASPAVRPAPAKPAIRPDKPDRPNWRMKWLRWPILIQTVTVALVVGLGLWVVSLNAQLQEARSQQSHSQQLVTLTAAPDSAIWDMRTGLAFDPTAPRARMYVQSGTNFYLVTATNFLPAPVGQVYQVWYVQANQVESGGRFTPNEKGQVNLEIARPTQSTVRAEITSCFITLEKSTDSTGQPTNPPIVRWAKA